MTLVVDASALVELLIGSPAGASVDRALSVQEVVAPELIDAEAIHTLARLERGGKIGGDHAAEAVILLAQAEIERVSHVELLEGAWRYRRNVSLHDALYVALAATLECPLLTVDRRIANAPGIDVSIHLIRRP